jgi:hypothetical protein
MSMLQEPEKVTVPATTAEPLLAFPSISMLCGWPRADVPSSVVWSCPSAEPVLEMVTPTPNLNPSRGTPLNLEPLGNTAAVPAVTVVSVSVCAPAGRGETATATRAAASQMAIPFMAFS